jgi:copper(I)-binding protein
VIKSITSTICEVAEIHDTVLEGEIMRMKKVESLNIPARSEFYFQPGSTHIMLMGLNQELKDGTNFKLNFEFKNKQNLNVEIMVLNKKLRENLLDKK